MQLRSESDNWFKDRLRSRAFNSEQKHEDATHHVCVVPLFSSLVRWLLK